MKRLLFLLLFLPFMAISQVVPPDATPLENIQITNNISSTTATRATVQETNGVQNYIPITALPIPLTPVNYSIPNNQIISHLSGIDTRLGQIGNTTAGLTARIYFTGDNTTVTAGTFFASNASSKGTVAAASPTALVNGDNTKQYFNKDLISIAQTSTTVAPPGNYSGQLSVSTTPTPNGTQQRYTVEIYRCNNGGTPISSGVSGAPIGDLGVTIVAVLDSGLINLVAGSITNITLSGVLSSTFTLNTGERLRYHVSGAKVGAGGGNITMNVFYGSNYNSFYDITITPTTDGIINKSIVAGLTSSDALNNLKSIQDTKQFRNPIYFRGKDIEWFGDSYIQGSGASSIANRFTSIVSRALGAVEINHGVAGTTMEKRVPIDYMASPNMVDNVVNIPTKTASKAMLVFAFGLNDMGQTAPAYSTINYKTDYQFVINNALSKGWLSNQILIIPAYYIGPAGYAQYAAITGNAAPDATRHLAFIQAAKEISDTNGTMYFDIYQDQKKNDITLLVADNIHPNDAGYAYIANDILQYLSVDKISVTSNTTFDVQGGFVPNIVNGNTLKNSLLYSSSGGVGIGTTFPSTTFHNNSTTDNVGLALTNSVSGQLYTDGGLFELDSSLNLNLYNRENGSFNVFTNNVKRATYLNNGRYLFNTSTDDGINNFQINGSITGSGLAIGTSTINSQAPIHSHVSGSGFIYTQWSNGDSGQAFGDGCVAGIGNDMSFNIYNFENKPINLATNATVRMILKETGVIQISNLSGTGTRQVIADASGNLYAGIIDSRPYKVYTALITQNSTSAPVATVLENTLGGTVVWSRSSTGVFLATLSGVFTSGKTALFQTISLGSGSTDKITSIWNSVNAIQYNTKNSSDVLSDSVLTGGSNGSTIEIRVYN